MIVLYIIVLPFASVRRAYVRCLLLDNENPGSLPAYGRGTNGRRCEPRVLHPRCGAAGPRNARSGGVPPPAVPARRRQIGPPDDQVLERCGDTNDKCRVHLVGCVGRRMEERASSISSTCSVVERRAPAAFMANIASSALMPRRALHQVLTSSECQVEVRDWTFDATL